nr:hypothetical protein [Tanacetum cinerariifolium]
MTQLTSMCELACQIVQKKQEEKRIEEEQAAKARYWKIPACCDDDDDYDFAITPVLSTEEPIDSLSMGDEHLDTILATESNKVIKSSVEDLIPIPSEFEGIPDTMCDVHLDNNHTPLEAKDHLEIVLNSNDDISSSDDDSLHEENIDSGLDLTYAPSTITKQQPTEGELDLLFEAMYDDYFGGQPSATVENVPPADMCERKPRKGQNRIKTGQKGKRGDAKKSLKQL